MEKYPWFRLYSEILHDKKITRVCAKTKQPKAVILGVWTILLSLANDSPARGKLLISDKMPVTIDEILFECGIGEAAEIIINEFISSNMLTWEDDVLVLTHWQDRQFSSDHSRERVKRFREKMKQGSNGNVMEVKQPKDATVTELKRYSNVTVTVQEKEKESDITTNVVNGKKPLTQPLVNESNTIDTPRKQLMGVFQSETGLKLPTRKTDLSFWWSSIGELYEMVDKDASRGIETVKKAVKQMRDDKLTISNPNSILNVCRAIISEPKQKVRITAV